mgnify:CR=1 FL=1
MASNTTPPNGNGRTNGLASNGALQAGSGKPDWADGLKRLYDSVVEEPLPDSFRDLLDQLDDADGGENPEGGARL